MKAYDSEIIKELASALEPHFQHFIRHKPDSSRKESRELFLVGLRFGIPQKHG